MEKYYTKIIEIRDECSTDVGCVRTYKMEIPVGLSWDEGAHMHVGIKGFDAGEEPNKSLVRHLSVMSLPDEGYMAFTTRLNEEKSLFKFNLDRLSVGDELVIFKVGSRMKLRRENRPLILVSQVISQATIRPLILKYSSDSSNIGSVTNINVDRSCKFTYRSELEKIEGVKYYWEKSRDELSNRLEKLFDKDAVYYIVGSDDFISSLTGNLLSRGIDENDIVLDVKPEKKKVIVGAC